MFISIDMECRIDIIVTPKSSKSVIVCDESSIKVYLHSPPSDGRANDECVVLFAKQLKMPKSMISIEKGHKGRKKIMRVRGLSREEVMMRIGSGK